MSKLFKHIQKVAIADARLFFEPFVAIFQFIKNDFNSRSVKH